MTETFVIPYPHTDAGKRSWSKQYGMNSYYAGKHWAQRQQDAQYWHGLARAEMDRQKVRRKPFEQAVIITLYFNDKLDIDNHAIMAKMIIDALKGRVIADDNRRCVKGIEMYFHADDAVRVLIREVE